MRSTPSPTVVGDSGQAGRASRRSRLRRRFGVIVLVALVLTVGYVIYLGCIVVKISTNPLNLSGLTGDGHGRTNILILGEGDPDHAGAGLTDTMMVLSYNAPTHQLAEISLPRDMRVTIPGYGMNKINAANALGGVSLAAQTVSNTLDVPINYVVQTDFSGISKLVDAVGGIDINVSDRLADPEYPCADNQYKACGLDIEPGMQHMNGATVLEYVRCRKGTCGNDFGRAARQQQVLGILKTTLVDSHLLLHPGRLNSIANALRASLTTDMSSIQLAEFGIDWQRASHHPTIALVLSTATGGYLTDVSGSSDLLPLGGSYASIQERINNIFIDPAGSNDVP